MPSTTSLPSAAMARLEQLETLETLERLLASGDPQAALAASTTAVAVDGEELAVRTAVVPPALRAAADNTTSSTTATPTPAGPNATAGGDNETTVDMSVDFVTVDPAGQAEEGVSWES